ncbi:MAG: hypothetical protein ACT4NP_13265 [Pseudonocardiales bacterium]
MSLILPVIRKFAADIYNVHLVCYVGMSVVVILLVFGQETPALAVSVASMVVTWVLNNVNLAEERKAAQGRAAQHAEMVTQLEQAQELLRTDARP